MSGTIDGTVIPSGGQPFVANLQLSTFSELNARSVNIAQTICPELTDFSPGSPMLALISVKAFGDLWLQWLIYVVFLNARLFTTTGPGVDTFLHDFGMTRAGALYSVGIVTFGRFSYADTPMDVPVGTVVQTADGQQRYVVIPDISNEAYNASTQRYTAPIGTATVDCLVQAATAGAAGNVTPGRINRAYTSVAGLNFVNNANPTVHGADGESDESYKARFVPYINSRSAATGTAIQNAILSVNPTLTYQILENANGVYPQVVGDPKSGTPRTQYGFFTVYIDLGHETVADKTTVAQVQKAINAIRPLTVDFFVTVPLPVYVDVEYLLEYKSGYSIASVRSAVKFNVNNYINTLGVGETLNYFRLATIIDETPGVKNVVFLICAGQTGNVGCGPGCIIKLGYLAYE